MSKFKPNLAEQSLLFGYNVDDFIEETHLTRLVEEIVERLDTSKIENKYSELGQKSYPPKMMIKLLFYSYAKGVFSSRKIQAACQEVLPYMYLSKMYKPDYRTISDFRKNNIEEIGEYFTDIVKYCNEIGLITVGNISIDGSKFRANASSKRSKTKSEYEKWEKKIREQVKILTEEAEKIDIEENNKMSREKESLKKLIKSKKDLQSKIIQAQKDLEKLKEENEKNNIKKEPRVNLTDKDSKYMKEHNGVIKANYNAQISVNDDNNIIIASDITTSPNDNNQLIPMIEQSEANLGIKIKEVKADSGYASFNNYKEMKERKIDCYIPDKEFYNDLKYTDIEEKNNYDKRDFKYDEKKNEYICPKGKRLKYYRISKRKDQNYYYYKCSECGNCPVKEKCCGNQRYKIIKRNELKYLQEEMRKKLSTSKGKQIYKKRMNAAESPFGHFKKNLRFVQFSLRTLKKVKGEFKLLCSAYNIMKIFNLKYAPA